MLPPISLTPKPADFVWVPIMREPLIDFEMGGAALSGANGAVKLWRTHYDGVDVSISAPGVAKTPIFTRAGITELSLAFDQVMSPVFFWSESGSLYYRWYDPGAADFVIVSLGAGITPRATMDNPSLPNGEVVFAYVDDGKLYVRKQSEGYATAHQIAADAEALYQIGFSTGNRMQFFYERS